jgi:hypothetical protein
MHAGHLLHLCTHPPCQQEGRVAIVCVGDNKHIIEAPALHGPRMAAFVFPIFVLL